MPPVRLNSTARSPVRRVAALALSVHVDARRVQRACPEASSATHWLKPYLACIGRIALDALIIIGVVVHR